MHITIEIDDGQERSRLTLSDATSGTASSPATAAAGDSVASEPHDAGPAPDIFGTDFHDMQANEFRYRLDVDRPIDILRSATSINAEIMQRAGELGVVAPGAKADLILIEGDPLKDISVLERFCTHLPLIIKDGEIIRRTLQ